MSIAPSQLSLTPPAARSLLSAVAQGKAELVRVTVDQYHAMIQQGIVPEDASAELLHGIVIHKDRSAPGENSMSHSPLHRAAVTLLTALAARIAGPRRHLQIQLPISIPPDHEPEPDAAVIAGAERDFLQRLPGPDDVRCVIEVAHSSIDRDQHDKLPIYAGAGIEQYLIINLVERCVEEYRTPDRARGVYHDHATRRAGQSVMLRVDTAEVMEVRVEDLLP